MFYILEWYLLLTEASIFSEAFRFFRYPTNDKVDRLKRHKPLVVRDGIKRRIDRLAILRPFSKENVESLSHAFNEWDAKLPCDITKNRDAGIPVSVDVILSYSQTFKSFKPARDHVRSIIDSFATNSTSGWHQCIDKLRKIEANIDPLVDLYKGNEAHKNRMWVHGPNQQFANSMRTLMDGKFGHYDAIFIMESDVLPVKQYWLDSLLEEAEKHPFMILGSKYNGSNWDGFRSSLPLSLQHHINGNAVYNATHPLLDKLLTQLQLEEDTPYHAIPYDYRISQILLEGMLGIITELPPNIVKIWRNNTGLELEQNSKKFRSWWEKYGRNDDGKPRYTLIRESQVITNYANTNLLPRHRESIKASIVHGGIQYESWDSVKYGITLVISEWEDELSSNLLSQIDASIHPFSKVILMVPHNMASHGIKRLSSIQTKIDLSIQKRKSKNMDICDALVDTEYFMMTNSYHVLSSHVDLLFTKDSRRLPVIPFIRADGLYCSDYRPCVEVYKKSKQFDRHNVKIVQDSDMMFKTDLRDKFCGFWRKRYGKESTTIKDVGINTFESIGPTATTYTSFLSMQGILSKFYAFFDSSIFGRVDNFARLISVDDEKDAVNGVSVHLNYIMKEQRYLHRRYLQQRYLQSAPSFIPPDTVKGNYTLPPSKITIITVMPVIGAPTKQPSLLLPIPQLKPNVHLPNMKSPNPSETPLHTPSIIPSKSPTDDNDDYSSDTSMPSKLASHKDSNSPSYHYIRAKTKVPSMGGLRDFPIPLIFASTSPSTAENSIIKQTNAPAPTITPVPDNKANTSSHVTLSFGGPINGMWCILTFVMFM